MVIGKLALAWGAMALCVAIHAAGVATALRRWDHLRPQTGVPGWTWLLVQVAGWMIVLHLAEIGLWGLLYAGGGAMNDLTSALYFSAVTYTTTGYGDLTLPESWRLVGGIEALTGIIMCGLSTGLFVGIVSRMVASVRQGPERRSPS